MAGELVERTTEIFYSDVWNEITSDVFNRDQWRITRGVADGGGSAGPGSATLTLNNGVSRVAPTVANRYSYRNPRSDLFGLIGPNTPVRLSACLAGGTPAVRAVQEIVALPPRSDVSGQDLWVPAQAAGLLQRLELGRGPLENTITRLARLNGATGYWPLDDPEGSRSARGFYGGRSLRTASTVAAPSYGAGRLAPWLPAGARTNGPTGSTGFVTASVVGATAGGWVLDFAYRAADPATWDGNTPHLFRATVTTEDQSWSVSIDGVGILATILGIDTDTAAVGSLLDGQVHHVRLSAVEAAGNTATLTVAVDGVQVISLTADIGMATIPAANLVSITSVAFSAALVPVDYGQFILWNTAPSLSDAYAAYSGHAGEAAGRRAERLCDEQSVPFTSTGDLDESAPMGPQYPEEFVTILDRCAEVEAGGSAAPILVEQPAAAGLHFNTLASLYLPRDADLTLDWSAAQIWEPFDPTPDNQRLVNDATVIRRGGGSVRKEQASGPRGVTTAGRVARQLSLDVLSDGQLANVAGYWLLHGTWDEDRFPTIRLNLRALSTRTGGAALLTAALALVEGSLLRITNMPTWMPAEDVEQIVLGITEMISTEEWLLDLHTTAARPFAVATVEDDDYGILQSGSAVTAEALDTTETGVDITCGAGPDWVHEVDFGIMIGGELMTVTAVSAMAGTFPNRTCTLTVVRSENGVTKSHASGAPIEFYPKSYIGL